jgi:putative restriction endonuclease
MSRILAMTDNDVIAAFDRMRVWQQGERRAVHKPLLVLFALARVNAGETAMIDWNVAEPHLKDLLEEFGPSGSSKTCHNPFWHLKTDGLWQLEGPSEIISRPASATPTLTELRTLHIQGSFPPELHQALARSPQLVATIGRRIVDAHFPASIRNDVLTGVGLPEDVCEGSSLREKDHRRDPTFREKVLLAYQYRCGICGHDLRLGRQIIGLEAAHIQWFQAKGPDAVPNGIALCSLHHKVFDLGAFTVLPQSFQIVFSQHLVGSDEAAGRMPAFHGAALILPQSRDYFPQPQFLDWHQKWVFKTPARA